MRGLWGEVNEFFTSTSIHGFPYISDNQSRSTRIIWTVIVLVGFGFALYFLYNTIDGFSDKYVTTTVETRNIREFPFPAVTFHPGDYNSKNAFLKNFLNKFEFTRYQENSPTFDNDEFKRLYKWILNDTVLDDVANFLVTEGIYVPNFRQLPDTDLDSFSCPLVALKNKNVSLEKVIKDILVSNLYKYLGTSMNLLRNEVSPVIQEYVSIHGLTDTEISSICEDPSNMDIKNKMEAMLLTLSYLFDGEFLGVENPLFRLFFMGPNDVTFVPYMPGTGKVEVGAGDVATGPYQTGKAFIQQEQSFHKNVF